MSSGDIQNTLLAYGYTEEEIEQFAKDYIQLLFDVNLSRGVNATELALKMYEGRLHIVKDGTIYGEVI